MVSHMLALLCIIVGELLTHIMKKQRRKVERRGSFLWGGGQTIEHFFDFLYIFRQKVDIESLNAWMLIGKI